MRLRQRLQQNMRLLALAALCAHCSGDGSASPDGGLSDGAPGDGSAPGETLTFATWTIDITYAGTHATLAEHQGTFGVAYYRLIPFNEREVDCPSAGLQPGGPKSQPVQDLMYVEFSLGDWGASLTPVAVDQTIKDMFGLSLAFSPLDGSRHIGYLGGAVGGRTCASSDAYIASSSDGLTFTPEFYADSVADFGTEPVAGHWTSVAFTSTGERYAAYRDVRLGFFEQSGELTADLRFGNSGDTATGDQNTDNGAGEFAFLLFGTDSEPVILHSNPVSSGDTINAGLWVSYRRGQTWLHARVFSGITAERPGFATDGQGRFALAYYDPGEQSLYYRESTDLLTWSTPERVEISATSHGKFSSLAFDREGNPAVSYYRCGPGSETTCDPTRDGAMLSYKRDGRWSSVLVDAGGNNACGTYTSLAFNEDNLPVIAYRCITFDSIEGAFVDALKVARGEWQ